MINNGDTDTSITINRSIQVLRNAIHQLTESRNTDSSNKTDCKNEFDVDDTRLLTNLISQLESIIENCEVKQSRSSAEAEIEEDQDSSTAISVETKSKALDTTNGATAEAIVEELRNLRRQNKTTHWLISGLIFLTVAWKLSEVSVVLILLNRLKNPLEVLKKIARAMLRSATANNQDPEMQEMPSSTIRGHSIESVTMPLNLMNISLMDLELLQIQLHSLVYGDDK